MRKSFVHGVIDALVALGAPPRDMVGILLNDVFGAVSRFPVDDDELVVVAALADDAVEGVLDMARLVEADGDDGECGHRRLFVKCSVVFLVIGLTAIIAALFIENAIISAIVGVFGASALWGIGELFEQEKRVERGWFPKNPKRKQKM